MTQAALVLLMLAPLSLYSQTLSVSSGSAKAGEEFILFINLESAAGQEPLGVEWTAEFPVQQITLDKKGPMAVEQARTAGKQVSCSGSWKKAPQIYAYHCILIGGLKPIANGPVAVFPFRVHSNTKSGKYKIRLEAVKAVSQASKQVVLKSAEATLTVQ